MFETLLRMAEISAGGPNSPSSDVVVAGQPTLLPRAFGDWPFPAE